jgi:hypothetical protein
MKTPTSTIVALLSFALLGSLLPDVPAQEMAASNSPVSTQGNPPSTNQAALPPSPADSRPHGPMANLTEQERAQLKAAHDKAIQQNPALEQAMKDAHQAMEKARKNLHDAMISVDPSVASLLAKIEPPKWDRPFHGEGRKGGEGRREWKQHGPPPGLANLSDQERTQLKAVHERIKADQSVVAARDAVKSASTPEARRAASDTLRQTVDAALLKADPSLGPVLDKLHQAGPAPALPPPPAEAAPSPQGVQ